MSRILKHIAAKHPWISTAVTWHSCEPYQSGVKRLGVSAELHQILDTAVEILVQTQEESLAVQFGEREKLGNYNVLVERHDGRFAGVVYRRSNSHCKSVRRIVRWMCGVPQDRQRRVIAEGGRYH